VNKTRRMLTAACWFALFAVALMIWSLFDPRPIPVIVAMSIGQGVGTLSLLVFAYLVLTEWRAETARQGSVERLSPVPGTQAAEEPSAGSSGVRR
jgi:hypothetical protein